MKRIDLLNAISELEGVDDMVDAIENLTSLAVGFCDHYEGEFNAIRDTLDALAPHIDNVNDAHDIAEKCSSDLY